MQESISGLGDRRCKWWGITVTMGIPYSCRKGAKEYGFGWGAQVLDEEDVLIIRSGDSRYLYVEEYELKRWE